MLTVVQNIPRGRVAAYSQVAALAGAPRNARQVGRILGEGLCYGGAPWHRVLGASGKGAQAGRRLLSVAEGSDNLADAGAADSPPSTPPVFGLRHLGSSAAADSADPGGGGSGGADLGIATAPYAPSAGDLPNTLHRDRFPALSVEPAGTRQGLHVTAFEMSRWLLLLVGRKRVRIFHRDDTPLLYPRYELSLDPTFQVDPEMNEVEPQGLLKVASSATNLKQRAGASSSAVSLRFCASIGGCEVGFALWPALWLVHRPCRGQGVSCAPRCAPAFRPLPCGEHARQPRRRLCLSDRLPVALCAAPRLARCIGPVAGRE